MKILIYRFQHLCEPDIIETFKNMGFEVIEDFTQINYPDYSTCQFMQTVGTTIISENYLFVFSINYFPWLSEVCNIAKTPYLSLVVSSPLVELYTDSIKNQFNRIFLFDKMQYNEFAPANPNNIFHIPLAANTARTDKLLSDASIALKQNFQSDISFIGSTYSEKCPFNLVKLPEYEQGYADGLIEAQLKIYGYNFIEDAISDEFVRIFVKSATGDIVTNENMADYKALVAQHYIGTKVSEQERLRLLKLVSEHFELDIYTGSDTSYMPHIHNRGFANSTLEMPLIFQQSKINLNITAKSIRSGLPLRIFDILGCGGFLITNYQPELCDFFEIGQDLITYDNPEDLLSKCSYYLSHDKERQQIATHGYHTVKQYHTWDIRLTQMLRMAFPEL